VNNALEHALNVLEPPYVQRFPRVITSKSAFPQPAKQEKPLSEKELWPVKPAPMQIAQIVQMIKPSVQFVYLTSN
jgi:hypothetical protein